MYQCPQCRKQLQHSEVKSHICNTTSKAIEKPDLVKRFNDFNLKK